MTMDVPENRHSVPVPKLGRDEQGDGLDRVVSSVDLQGERAWGWRVERGCMVGQPASTSSDKGDEAIATSEEGTRRECPRSRLNARG